MESFNGLRAARLDAGWSQARLIAAMRAAAPKVRLTLPSDDSLKTNIKRWEGGRVTPGPEYRRLFSLVYGLTLAQLGLLGDDAADVVQRAPHLPMADDALDYYARLLVEHVRADNLLGSGLVRDIVGRQAADLAEAVKGAGERSRTSARLVRVACRYHEFYGWLLQDAGAYQEAARYTAAAWELSQELGDPQLTNYLLMRRSNIASDGGDPRLAADLANAALTSHDINWGPKDLAVLLRQKANACADLGMAAECTAALDEALEVAAQRATEESELAGYCTTGYVAMEAGACWLRLDRPELSLGAFRSAESAWHPVQHRDRGLADARLARAYAGVGEWEAACAAAVAAVDVCASTGSARILRQLRHVKAELQPWRRQEQVIATAQAITNLAGAG